MVMNSSISVLTPWLETISSLKIAEAIGITKRAVNYIKCGKRYPKKETKEKIILFLDKQGEEQQKQEMSKEIKREKTKSKTLFHRRIQENG